MPNILLLTPAFIFCPSELPHQLLLVLSFLPVILQTGKSIKIHFYPHPTLWVLLCFHLPCKFISPHNYTYMLRNRSHAISNFKLEDLGLEACSVSGCSVPPPQGETTMKEHLLWALFEHYSLKLIPHKAVFDRKTKNSLLWYLCVAKGPLDIYNVILIHTDTGTQINSFWLNGNGNRACFVGCAY